MAILNELRKALTTANAPDLLPYDLEQTLHDELLNLQPLAQMMSVLQAEGLTHEYRFKTAHPIGWFEGEETRGADQQGAYTRKSVQLKISRMWGSVTGFAQTVDERFINALAEEVSGAVMGMSDLFEYGVMYGCSNDIGFTGDAYQYSGILPRLYAYAPENIIDAGGVKVTLDMLDKAIAVAHKHRQTRNDPSMWLMGLRMKQVVDGLQSKVMIPLQSTVLADGKIEMPAYYKRPIYETDYVVPTGTVSPTPTAALAAGGTLSTANALQYRISSVTAYGEQVGSVASGSVTPSAGNLTVNLTWTADPAAKLYMVFRKDGAGAFKLLDIIPALTYDASGKVNGARTTYSDTGAITALKAVKPLEQGEEHICLFNIQPNRGAAIMGKVDDMGRQVDRLIQFVELARVKDTYDFMLKNYSTLRLVYPNLLTSIRHVKTA